MPIQKITSGVIESSQTLTTPTISGNLSLDSTGTTGVQVPSANTLAFHTAGTEDMRIDSSGRVGIGTNSPQTCLDVVSGTNGANSWAWFHSNTGGATPNANINSGLMLGSNYSAGNSESNIMWGTGYNSATQHLAFSTWNQSTVTEQARITAAGLFYMNSGYGSSAPVYGCRAWVNFFGGAGGGAAGAINGSGNVSSVTDNGVGDYTVNFTNAMPDVNYATVCGCREDLFGVLETSNRVVNPRRSTDSITTTTVRIGVADFGYAENDVNSVYVTIFR